MSALPSHTCGAGPDEFPTAEGCRTGCAACVEGGMRILDALRVIDSPEGCWEEALQIVRTARYDGVEIEVKGSPPNIPVAWAGVLRCPHGTLFYHRPTRDWVARQNARS